MSLYSNTFLYPDLPAIFMEEATELRFKTYVPTYSFETWDWYASARDDGDFRTPSVYKFVAKDTSVYDVFSSSFFDPSGLRIYDKDGHVIATNDESRDPRSTSSDSSDVIWDWKPPYTGVFYVEPRWSKGVYHTYASLSVYEDVNPKLPPAPAPAPVTLPVALIAPAPRPEPAAPASNVVNGTDAADTLRGGDGMDLVAGGSGNDTVSTGLGNDFVRGGGGNDTLDGGAGIDTAQYAGAYSAYTVTVDPVSGAIKVAHNAGGADGTDVTSNFEFYQFGDKLVSAPQLALLNAPQLRGTDANDSLSGTASADAIFSGKGNDSVSGGGGNDLIVTGKGSHTANGGAGIDTLYLDTVSIGAQVTKGIVMGSSAQTATLAGIERVQFKDKYVVLDLEPGTSGNKAALLAYTLKGGAGLKDADLLAKTLLPLFDSGFSVADVSSYLIDSGYMAGLAGGTSNAQFVATLFKAVTGTAADSATVAVFEGLITSGAYTQATMLAGVAQLELVGTAANLPQYANTGLALGI